MTDRSDPRRPYRRPQPSPGTGRAVVAGLLAAAAGVAVGELIGGILTSAGSPVVAVGGYVIDHVPPGAKDFAIETFGTNDKLALIVGTLVILALLGMALGPLARRRPRAAATVVVLVSLTGVAATVSQMDVGPLVAVWPSMLGAGAAVAVMTWLRTPSTASRSAAPLSAATSTVPATKAATSSPSTPSDELVGAGAAAIPARTHLDGPTDDLPPRRRFLVASGTTLVLAGAAAAAGRFLAGRNSAAASREALVLPEPVEQLPPIPPAVAANPAGVTPFITPNRDFYRIDINLITPQITTEGYSLKVKGMVERELEISWADLIDRDLREYDITLTCVSNQIGGELVGNARWLGFPLRDLLDEAGVGDGVDQIVGRSSDGYTGGFPLEAAYDRDTIVAVGMNGQPLPIDHGYPVRLVTPGIYGYLSAIKWLTEIELTTFDAFDSYWVPRGYSARAPIRTMSRIDTPKSLSKVEPGPTVIGGVAWAQTRGIDKVEVQIDGGEWQEAELAAALNKDTWRQWTLAFDATSGFHTVKARATDGTGETQPEERREPLPNGATGWHTLRFSATG